MEGNDWIKDVPHPMRSNYYPSRIKWGYKKMIYQKIDAYSAIFYGWSINGILKKLVGDRLNAFDIFRSMFDFEKAYKHHEVYADSFCFISNGIFLSIPFRSIEKLEDRSQIFDEVLDSIRLELKGEALDYLRDLGVDVDSNLNNINFWEEFDFSHQKQPTFNVTRIDIAFDFINEFGTFFNDFRTWYNDSLMSGTLSVDQRLCTSHCGMGMSNWEFKDGSSEKLLYIGSKGSPKILRIYDKVLEYASRGIVNQTDFPEQIVKDVGEVKSWIRFELQARRHFVPQVMYSEDGLRAGWRFIEENFLLRHPVTKIPLPFFEEIINSIKTRHFSPIFYFVQSHSFVEKVQTQIHRSGSSTLTYIESFGFQEYLKELLKYIASIKIVEDIFDSRSVAYKIKLANTLSELGRNYSERHLIDFLRFCDSYGLVDEVNPSLRLLLD